MSQESELRSTIARLEHRVKELEEANHALSQTPPDQFAHLRAAFNTALDAILVADDEGRYVAVNPAACQLFGVPREVLLGRRIPEFVAPGYDVTARWQAFEQEGAQLGEFPLLRPDGQRREVEYSAVTNFLPGRHVSFLRDVTARKAAERALRTTNDRLQMILRNAPLIVFATDREGVFTVHDGRALESVGLQPGTFVGQSIFHLLHRWPGSEAKIRRAFAGEEVQSPFDMRGHTFDCTLLPLRDETGAVCGLTGLAVDVTARQNAMAALSASERRFRAMVEKSQDGITLLDARGQQLYATPAVDRITGYPPGEAHQMGWQGFVDEEWHAPLAEALGRLLERPEATVSLEFPVRHKDGQSRWLDLVATNLLHDPDVCAIVSNFRDVTERRTFARDLDGVFRTTLDLIAISDANGWLRRTNPAWRRLGWSDSEMLSRPWVELVHPEDRARSVQAVQSAPTSGSPVELENRCQCKDGSYRWIRWALVYAPEEKIVYGTGHDITERRAAAERDRLQFRLNPLAMFLVDAESLAFLDVNDAASRMYGYTRDEFLAMHLEAISPGITRAEVAADAERTLVDPSALAVRRVHSNKAGGRLLVDVIRDRLEFSTGPVILSVVQDVTARVRIEDRLRASEEKYRRIVDNSSEGIWIYDADGIITFMNPSMRRMLGLADGEGVGRSVFEFVPEEDQQLGRERLARRISGMRETIEGRARRHDGSCFPTVYHAVPLLDAEGRFEDVLCMVMDVTEQRRAAEALARSEQQLRQAQKMEAIGTLAGGVAHDFNNILSVIISYSMLALQELKPGDPLREDIEQIDAAGKRAAGLTRQLLAFSRRQILQPTVLDVNQVVLGLEKMLGRLLGEDIELSFLTTSLGRVRVDPGQLEQVIMNLVVNARDAMPRGGKLTIETADVEMSESQTVAMAAGPYVLVAVTDTGTGMDKEIQARIFEPFFTTKEKGKGTGLGLSTSYGIVKQSGGFIWVYSEPGRGTTFKVYLPRSEEQLSRVQPSLSPWASLRGSETILVAEDEDQVRAIACSVLRRNGYQVLEAPSADAALGEAERFQGTIHLLLTDVVMPGMGGRQLAEGLVRARPGLEVLYMSGYTEDTVVHHGILDAGIQLLSKPLTPDTLLRKVREVLDAGASIEPREAR